MNEKIIEIASRVFHIKATNDTSQATCPVWDSLRHINLIIELEAAFDMQFEPEEIAAMKSIAEIKAMILGKQK
ncbi:MAG: acyl carrier protein [Tannerella sp.]|jgi:acyl carrier protein|nr:acyl carrier protein [Tannerella sp.]